MNEMKKTMVMGGVAVALALLAFVTSPRPVTPDAFFDKGEPFFPGFQDPNIATSMEVVVYNEESGQPVPFKVVFKDGRYTIPSHHDYPADGEERLAKTAAGVISLKKEDFRTNNVVDHEACGVIDPLDETDLSATGRGKRITLTGANDQVLADVIIGKDIEGREGYHFVRMPGQKRVYVANANFEISTKFSDWIEADLLQVDKNDINQVTIKDYSINERTGRVNNRDVLILDKDGTEWTANKLSAKQGVNTSKANQLLTNIDGLNIVGIRPKPAGLTESLKQDKGGIQIATSDMRSLQSKGFYFGPSGDLLSNEGEMEVRTQQGIVYTLRFGEIAYGSGFDLSAGSEEAASASGPGENRYLFITAYFDKSTFPEPKLPADTTFLSRADSLWSSTDRANKERFDAHEAWRNKVDAAMATAENLKNRFAGWYYVISADSYGKLNKKRADLIRDTK